MNQVLKFLVVGGVAAVLNWGSRFVFSIWFSFEIAVVFAFFVGLTSAFFLMQRYVFVAQNNSLKTQLITFLIINLLALVLTVTVSSISLRLLLPQTFIDALYHEPIAHMLGIIAPIFTSFIGHKHLTFR